VSGRLSLLLVLGFLFGLCAWLGPPAKHRTENDSAGPAVAAADVPIVSVRGRPLATYEEPLPAGARVRIGSTRYRHPDGWEHSGAQVAGPYFVAMVHGELVLTEVATGRRLRSQPIPPGRDQYDFHQLTASPDGRIVVWTYGGPSSDRIVAQVWETRADPGQPVRFVTSLRMPESSGDYFFESVFFPEGRSEVWVVGNGIDAFDTGTGAHRRHVRSKNRILTVDKRGTRFLTSSDYDPRFSIGFGGGSYVLPAYGFRAGQRVPVGRPRVRPLKGHGDDPTTELLTLMVVDSRTGGTIEAVTIPRERGEAVRHLDLSPNGRYVSYEVADHLCVFDTENHRIVLDLDLSAEDGHDREWSLTDSWFSENGSRLVVSDRKAVKGEYDLATGQLVPSRAERPVRGLFGGVWTRRSVVSDAGALRPPTRVMPPGYAGVVLADAPDQRLLAVGDATGRLDVWQPDGQFVKSLGRLGKGVSALAFSPDGRRLAGCDRGRTICVWSVGTWRERDRFQVPADHDIDELCPDHLVFSPNSQRLLVSRGDVLALWDLATRAWVWDRSGADPWSPSAPPAFTPDGLWILAHGRDSWLGAPTGESIHPIPGIDLLRSTQDQVAWNWSWTNHEVISMSPDGVRMALIDDHGALQVSPARGAAFRPFPESTAVVKQHGILRFSPDGRRLVTCDDAGHAHVWEVASGQLAFTLTYPDGAIHDVRFGADGRSLITSNHREVIVWDLMPEPGAAADPWAGLAAEAPQAEQARRALLADPSAAVELLNRRLRSATPVDPAAVAGLLTKLDAADYRERARAAAAIQAIGRRVLPLLREATVDSEEAKTRLAAMIRELSAGPTAYELRDVRAVEVLEQIGSPAAWDLLQDLAAGDAGSVLTEEARAAGRRLH
jgi:WD40 repeat protein